ALLVNGHVEERHEDAPRVQAEQVLPMVERLLAESGLKLGALDAIAFGRGPGAFTGLRVAASVAQGLAFGAGLPVVPVSDLAALAWSAHRAHSANQVVACLDARMGEIYWGAYGVSGRDVMALSGEALSAPGDLQLQAKGPWFGAGSGWAAHGEALKDRVPRLLGVDSGLVPGATDVVALAARAFSQGAALPAGEALPVYLRDRVATPKL
ncbi:MAG TPA: tRNA (adenosine(37)-N6)-threonylcarbamoyltransferase complex dimerization subunit type 1 TsaB, partial [Gammaproteobacteria bacterium]|nr:tRNA (adenosine(37)-N6)-threonylcarbamoyltransferase complex dimerization subunit type 1 TsaB [Gammaproteobacteria bacterium]